MKPLATLVLLAAAGLAPRAYAVVIAEGGQARCIIGLAQDAIPAERTAAQQLVASLGEATGGAFALQDVSALPADAPCILVGPSERARALLPEIDFEALESDEIVLRTVGDVLVLAGGRPRGTLYAVNTFLEDTVGFRWWTSTESFTPHRPDLAVEALDVRHAPKLMSREVFFKDAFDPLFATRLKANGHFEPIPEELGGHIELLGWCHTFWPLLPPEEHFAEHPEWYSEVGGTRTAEGTQICLTNEGARAEVTRRVLEQLRANPGARLISVSQNDWGGRCECAACRAVEAEEGSPSGPLVRFVNAVAEAVEAEFPDVLVETLAYQYTRKAPRLTHPRDNVVIRLCSIECDYAQPLTSPANATFADDIRAWSAIAPNLYIWNYVVNFANFLLPHPNLAAFAEDIRFFVDHGAVGIFEQGDAYSHGGHANELRAWVLAHLLWDPSLDQRALTEEFMNGYFGPAGPHVLAALDAQLESLAASGSRLGCYHGNTDHWLTLEALDRATEAMNAAAEAARDDADLSRRVRLARLPLDHVWLLRYGSFRLESRLTGLPFLGPESASEGYESFARTLEEFGTGFYGEGRPLEGYLATLKAMCAPRRTEAEATIPEECANLPADAWVDVQDVSFMLHNLGQWVDLVEDADASDGGAARMPGSSTQWAIQWPVVAGSVVDRAWHVRVVARCEPVATEGQAFTIGIYDGASGKSIEQRVVSLAEAGDGKYHTWDLGVHILPAGSYIWVAPPGDESLVKSVSVDRVFLVKAP